MKYCDNCGSEIANETDHCQNCGCKVEQTVVEKSYGGINGVIKVFLIIGTICTSIYGFFIPMIWCIPMTISAFKKLNNGKRISTGFKICILLFVNTLAGILLLCRKEKDNIEAPINSYENAKNKELASIENDNAFDINDKNISE